MEQAAHKIANRISANLGYSQEKTEVIAYGLIAMIQMTTILIIVILIGLIGNFWLEALIVFFTGGILRKSIGGAHSKSYNGCLIISILTISLIAFLAKFLFVKSSPVFFIIFLGIIYLFSFIVVYQKAPVDSPNKPIVKPEKIARLRRNAFITLSVYILVTSFLLYFSQQNYLLLNLALSIAFATLWQTFMLTRPGAMLIGTIDRKFLYD